MAWPGCIRVVGLVVCRYDVILNCCPDRLFRQQNKLRQYRSGSEVQFLIEMGGQQKWALISQRSFSSFCFPCSECLLFFPPATPAALAESMRGSACPGIIRLTTGSVRYFCRIRTGGSNSIRGEAEGGTFVPGAVRSDFRPVLRRKMLVGRHRARPNKVVARRLSVVRRRSPLSGIPPARPMAGAVTVTKPVACGGAGFRLQAVTSNQCRTPPARWSAMVARTAHLPGVSATSAIRATVPAGTSSVSRK